MKKEKFEPGCYYHVFNSGNNKEKLYKEDGNYRYFLRLMKKYLGVVFEIHAYCLMSNHFHWLIRVKHLAEMPMDYQTDKRKIHQPMSNMLNAYAKAINKRYSRKGSLFQEHIHSIRIRKESYFKRLVIYIHKNPYHHGFSNDFRSYEYSSYQAYFSRANSQVYRELTLELLGGIENFEFEHHQVFVECVAIE